MGALSVKVLGMAFAHDKSLIHRSIYNVKMHCQSTQTDAWMDGWMDGRYQVHYLPGSRSIMTS